MVAEAIIYQPTKNAMQSGKKNQKLWLLEFRQDPENRRYIESLMGWTASQDTFQQMKLKFKTKEEATKFAESKGIKFFVKEPKKAKTTIRSYAENFTS